MPLLAQRWIAVGAALAALGVALGAYGAHGLPGQLADWGYQGDDLARRLDTYDTAVRYHMLHAVGLVLIGLALAAHDCRAWRWAAIAMLVGVAVFSGLLYVLALAGPKWLGMIVPIGGLLMIVAWALLAIGALRQ